MSALTTRREKLIATCAVVVGILLYLSKFLRSNFADNEAVLFVLGFLPNLGLAFTLPFIYISNRIRLAKPVKHFNLACFVTYLLMTLNEVRDAYLTGMTSMHR